MQELKRNRGNTKSLLIIISFRASHFFTKNAFLRIIGIPVRLFYKFFIEWMMSVEIPDTTKIGYGFKVINGQGLVINNKTIIGNNVTVRQNTTIGNSFLGSNSPTISSNVNIGANSVIIGDIVIGENVYIEAGSVILKNVPSNSIASGNPAVIRSNN